MSVNPFVRDSRERTSSLVYGILVADDGFGSDGTSASTTVEPHSLGIPGVFLHRLRGWKASPRHRLFCHHCSRAVQQAASWQPPALQLTVSSAPLQCACDLPPISAPSGARQQAPRLFAPWRRPTSCGRAIAMELGFDGFVGLSDRLGREICGARALSQLHRREYRAPPSLNPAERLRVYGWVNSGGAADPVPNALTLLRP